MVDAASGALPDVNVIVTTANTNLMNIANAIPLLVAAVLLAIVGWIVGVVISKAFQKLLQLVKFEEFLASHKIDDALGKVRITNVLVQVVKYYVILVFVQAAVGLLALGALTDFLGQVLDYAPKVIGAVLVLVIAAIVGELAREKINEVDPKSKEGYLHFIASTTKYVVLYVGLVVAMDTVGFSTNILTATFVTLLQAMGIAFALAFGLAFGFGGQDLAKDLLTSARKRLRY